MNMTDDQKRKIMIFDLPSDGWSFCEDETIELLIVKNGYTDRWQISPDGSTVIQERQYQHSPNIWMLMCPDCGYPYNKDDHGYDC